MNNTVVIIDGGSACNGGLEVWEREKRQKWYKESESRAHGNEIQARRDAINKHACDLLTLMPPK